MILPHMHLKELVLLLKEAFLVKSPKMKQLPVALQPMQLRVEIPLMLLTAATPRLIFWRVDVWFPQQHPSVVKLLNLKTTFIQLLKLKLHQPARLLKVAQLLVTALWWRREKNWKEQKEFQRRQKVGSRNLCSCLKYNVCLLVQETV